MWNAVHLMIHYNFFVVYKKMKAQILVTSHM